MAQSLQYCSHYIKNIIKKISLIITIINTNNQGKDAITWYNF